MSTYFDVSNLFTMDSIFTTEPLFDFYMHYLCDYLHNYCTGLVIDFYLVTD